MVGVAQNTSATEHHYGHDHAHFTIKPSDITITKTILLFLCWKLRFPIADYNNTIKILEKTAWCGFSMNSQLTDVSCEFIE